MDVGAKLKEARLAKDMSLDSLQEKTKIQKRYLTAIEEGNMHILPGKFYARAFIKEYAGAVGLDPDELLEEYEGDIPKQEEEEIEYTRMQRTRKGNQEKETATNSIFPKVILALLIIGIIVAAFWFINERLSGDSAETIEDPQENVIIDNPDNNEGETPAAPDEGQGDSGTTEEPSDEQPNDSEAEETPGETEEEQPEISFNVTEQGAGSPPTSTVELTEAPEEMTVRLESTDAGGESWLEVTSDGESVFNGMFSPDASPVEFDASNVQEIYFSVGHVPAVDIYVNDVLLEYPVDTSEVYQKIYLNIKQVQ